MARRIIGIDTGGTFTDFVLLDGGEVSVHKEPSTPDNPARAVVAGFRRLLAQRHHEKRAQDAFRRIFIRLA